MEFQFTSMVGGMTLGVVCMMYWVSLKLHKEWLRVRQDEQDLLEVRHEHLRTYFKETWERQDHQTTLILRAIGARLVDLCEKREGGELTREQIEQEMDLWQDNINRHLISTEFGRAVYKLHNTPESDPPANTDDSNIITLTPAPSENPKLDSAMRHSFG